jgi:hypothetical protein
VQKLHKEKDNNVRLDKRLRSRQHQFEETKTKFEKEIVALEEQLRIKTYDRQIADNECKNLEDQIQKLRLSVDSEDKIDDLPDGAKSRAAKSRFPVIKSH